MKINFLYNLQYADNTQLSLGSGGDIIATDDISGVKYQRIKNGFGVDGSYTDASATNPLPTTVPSAFVTGTFTAVDAVVAAPAGDGTLVSGASTSGSVISMIIPDGQSDWVALITGYTTGTVYSEASTDSTNGTNGNWTDIKGRRTGTAVGIESTGYAFTSNGYWRGNPAGFKWIRLRYLGTFTASLSVRIDTSSGVGSVFLNSGLVTSNSIIGKVGIDQTTPGTTNLVSVTGTQKATYRASTTALLVPAVTSPNPFLTIYGSATKTVKIQSIIISGLTLTAVAYLNIGVRKYSTAVSGGTSAALTRVPMDSTAVGSSATNVNVYTAIPTAGTVVGDIDSVRVLGQSTTAAAAGIPEIIPIYFNPGGDGTFLTLRGINEGIGLYWITAPATTPSLLCRIEWTEE